MAPWKHFDRDRLEELCCLSVLGQLSVDESRELALHLAECADCRELKRDCEKIALESLPLVAAGKLNVDAVNEMSSAAEDRLFNRVMQSMRDPVPPVSAGESVSQELAKPQTRKSGQLVHALRPVVAGWVASILVAVGFGYFTSRALHTANPPIAIVGLDKNLQGELDDLRQRAKASEVHDQQAMEALEHSRSEAREALAKLQRAEADLRRLSLQEEAVASENAGQAQRIEEQSSNLTATRADLDREREKGVALQAQLQQITAQWQSQKDEVAQLRRTAMTVVAHNPSADLEPSNFEAREIFGARDLHIIDVSDVDHSGKASLTYGRIYYVNHKLLLFYAFDLSNKEKSRRPVAFQAWGFRQPNSTTPESLGLFYMDDAKLDRWALRVSDPRVLAHIDTVFVTIEPPGGSQAPKGRELLLASLAGPPNHP